MIIGIGTDIIDIRRIENIIQKYGEKFKKRCFSINEIKRSENKFKTANSYAKRYAAKEACSKALGIGLAKGIKWKDIGVINDQNGKPNIELIGNALERFKFITPSNKALSINLTLTDEKNLAYAMVIISSTK